MSCCTTDEGCLAPRYLFSGSGIKPPTAAAIKSCRGERDGKRHCEKCQVCPKKMNESEPFDEASKTMNRRQNQGPSNLLGETQKIPDYYLGGDRRIDGMSFGQAVVRNTRTCRLDDKGEIQENDLLKNESTDAGHRDGATRSSDEGRESVWSKGVASSSRTTGSTLREEEPSRKTKPFCICKWDINHAYQQVRKKGKAPGVDGQTIENFEAKLRVNQYRLWNRMSSGSYFPPPVRRQEIPKSDGKRRVLGIPTISDRIAQSVVKMHLEAATDKYFHKDSFGYRPGKSAHEALGVTRRRCWKFDWVIDLDIKGFFDNLDWNLVMDFVKKYTNSEWILLYVQRWLEAPIQLENGELQQRTKGSPQGGVISPLLANIFLHEVFDTWMTRNYPKNPFERYADDIVVHCNSFSEAHDLCEAIKRRLQEYKLEVHPTKTKIVYCKDDNRTSDYKVVKFDFLGYTFRPRQSKNRHGYYFLNFTPGVSQKASKHMRNVMRSWVFHKRSDLSLEELAEFCNRRLTGWINYYGKYNRSALYNIFVCLNRILMKWARRKYKRLKKHKSRTTNWLCRIAKDSPKLFAHWHLLKMRPGLDDGSRMN